MQGFSVDAQNFRVSADTYQLIFSLAFLLPGQADRKKSFCLQKFLKAATAKPKHKYRCVGHCRRPLTCRLNAILFYGVGTVVPSACFFNYFRAVGQGRIFKVPIK